MLEARGLEARFGGALALRGVDLRIGRGEVVCLIGANGAGKTTLLALLAGLLRPSAGTIRFAGQDVGGLKAHVLARRGLILCPEGRRVFDELSVAENLTLGGYARRRGPELSADLAAVYERFPRLAERRKQPAGALSGGEQQMLAIGRALMAGPKLLMLDEPSLGLAPLVAAEVFGVIKNIAGQGVTVLLVEQNARAALAISQRGYVLENGRVTLEGPSAELAANDAVRRAYLGLD